MIAGKACEVVVDRQGYLWYKGSREGRLVGYVLASRTFVIMIYSSVVVVG